jgi:mono/diheme cytochrome c family protein
MKRLIKLILLSLTVLAGFWVLTQNFVAKNFTVQAMPAWSRKYSADCTLCHTTYPRLNRTGYEFKKRGYRFEWESEKDNKTSTGPVKTASYTPSPATDSSRAGEVLYRKLDCATCHSIKGEGGKVGPALDGIGAQRTAQFLIGHMTDPQKHAGNLPLDHPNGAMMPATAATADEIAQLAAYMMTLSSNQAQEQHKTRVTDYLAVSYSPSIEIERANGETNRNFDTRGLVFYAAGPIGNNFSFFVQPVPLSKEKGFLGKFEMAQGLLNFGGGRNYVQVRFGQLFNLRNAGFGGTDRGLTETQPFIFQPVNGFNSGGLGRGISVEYTLGATSTFKAFGVSNESVELAPEVEEPPTEDQKEFSPRADRRRLSPLNETLELQRSRAYGFVYEQIVGKKGLSGVSFQFSGGRTPVLLEGARQDSIRFQRYSFFANKTFLDKRNFERVNAIFGASLLRDSRFVGLAEIVVSKSRGNGFFFEIDTIPLPKHLTIFGRYDQLRQTNLLRDNTLHGATTGVIFDPYRYARLSLEYQRLYGTERSDRFRIGLQFNF